MKSSIWTGRAATIALLAALAGIAVPSAQAAPPSLRMFGVERQVSVTQLNLRAGVVDLGVWVTPVGGAFQIDVRRPGYGRWTADQVDPASGALLRPVPINMVDPARGLKRFLSIRFIDSKGHVAATRMLTFCPNGESARVDDTGPLNPTYPPDCASALSFPFVRGLVWGIDSGWAVEPSLSRTPFFGAPFGGGFPPPNFPPSFLRHLGRHGINLKPGRYTAVVRITSAYRRLFGIPASQAKTKVGVRVVASPSSRAGRNVGVLVGRPAIRGASDAQTGTTPAAPDPATLPNLVALPAWGIHVRRAGSHELLTFSATIWNAGPAPFSIEGFRRPDSNIMDAYEYFFDAAGNVVGSAPAGTLYYDNGRGHHHWHLAQLAAYELLGPSGQVVRSHKQSFCIAPTSAVDLTVPGAELNPMTFGGLGFGGSVCDLYSPGAIWVREQLPAGWGDTYTQFVAGQAFDITNLPNGRYRVEVRVNPLGVLTETSTADDIAFRVIHLSGQKGARKVSVSPWHGIRA